MSTKRERERAVVQAGHEIAAFHPLAFEIYRNAAEAEEVGPPKSNDGGRRKRIWRQAIRDLREDHPEEWRAIYDRWVEHFVTHGESGGCSCRHYD